MQIILPWFMNTLALIHSLLEIANKTYIHLRNTLDPIRHISYNLAILTHLSLFLISPKYSHDLKITNIQFFVHVVHFVNHVKMKSKDNFLSVIFIYKLF